MNSARNLRALAVTAIAAGAVVTAHAADPMAITLEQKSNTPWEKGSVKLGGFLAAFNSDLGFGVNNAAGVTVNAEDLFGLDSSLAVWRAEAMYRPGESRRHQLDFTYARYHRDGTATLAEDLIINGVTYPTGAQVDSIFNFDIIRGTYTYAFLQDERVRIAGGLGVYAVPLQYGIGLTTSSGRTAVDGGDTTLPLPALALRGEVQLVPKVFLNASLDAMYLEIDSFQGSLMDVSLSVEYRPWEHFGIGVGYNGMSVNVEAEDSNSSYPGVNFVGTVDVRYSGLMLYAKYSF